MIFSTKIFIPFQMADPAGILFFGNAFTLAHQTYEQFVCDRLELPWESWFQNEEWFVPIKHTEANYHRPLLAGQSCSIQMYLKEIRTSSFHLHYEFSQNNILCCSVQAIHVFCNKHTGQKQPIPHPIQQKLSTL